MSFLKKVRLRLKQKLNDFKMKKNIFLVIFCLLTSIQMYGQTLVNGIYYNFSGTTAEVTKISQFGNDYSGDVVVPGTVTHNGTTYNVTSIGGSAFSFCKNLISINLPASITSIDGNAFVFCSNLMSIDIPSNVTSIGHSAFNGCAGLTSIEIPSGITSIEDRTFYDCTNIRTISIPESVQSIGEQTFYNCKNLELLTIPEGVTSIGELTFYGCSNLVSIDIPNSVVNISRSAFYNCSKLGSVSMSSNLESIGDGAFYGCAITSIDIPNTMTSIGENAFFACSNLANISFGDNISYIGDGAFSGTEWYNNQPDGIIYIGKTLYAYKGTMPQNTTINIKSGTTCISGHAFYGCSGLNSIIIPPSVTKIGISAFMNCPNLSSIVNLNPVPQSLAPGAFVFDRSGNITLYVPVSSVFDYQKASEFSGFNTIGLPNLSVEDIDIAPTINGAIIEWQSYENAEGYRLIIYSDEAHTDTIYIFEFDAEGKWFNTIPFRSASANFSYTIEDLSSGTDYYYTLEILGVGNVVLASLSDKFTTANEPTSIDVPLVEPAEAVIVGYYSILGKKLPKEPERGFYIIMYSNGKTEKVLR
jgi:hypothetical protein